MPELDCIDQTTDEIKAYAAKVTREKNLIFTKLKEKNIEAAQSAEIIQTLEERLREVLGGRPHRAGEFGLILYDGLIIRLNYPAVYSFKEREHLFLKALDLAKFIELRKRSVNLLNPIMPYIAFQNGVICFKTSIVKAVLEALKNDVFDSADKEFKLHVQAFENYIKV